MQFNDVLENMDWLIGKPISVSGWLVDASYKGFGWLFYLAANQEAADDTSRAILISHGQEVEYQRIARAIAFIATYGKLSPIEARVTGTLVEEYDSIFLLRMADIIEITVVVPSWGYTGYYRPGGVPERVLGLPPFPIVDVSTVLQDLDSYVEKPVIVEGVMTGGDRLSTGTDVCYLTSHETMAEHPGVRPVFNRDVTEKVYEDAVQTYEQKRERYLSGLRQEQQRSILVQYAGILRKIIAPRYDGRTFSADVRLTGNISACNRPPFPAALTQVRWLILQGEDAVQIWDLRQFPYGSET
jgi:hypothetical protein